MFTGKSNTRTIIRAKKIGVNGEVKEDLGVISETNSDLKSEKEDIDIDKVIEPTNKS